MECVGLVPTEGLHNVVVEVEPALVALVVVSGWEAVAIAVSALPPLLAFL